jgi:hypothetical protein
LPAQSICSTCLEISFDGESQNAQLAPARIVRDVISG